MPLPDGVTYKVLGLISVFVIRLVSQLLNYVCSLLGYRAAARVRLNICLLGRSEITQNAACKCGLRGAGKRSVYAIKRSC